MIRRISTVALLTCLGLVATSHTIQAAGLRPRGTYTYNGSYGYWTYPAAPAATASCPTGTCPQQATTYVARPAATPCPTGTCPQQTTVYSSGYSRPTYYYANQPAYAVPSTPVYAPATLR